LVTDRLSGLFLELCQAAVPHQGDIACPLSGEGSGESDPGGAGRLAGIADGVGLEEYGGLLTLESAAGVETLVMRINAQNLMEGEARETVAGWQASPTNPAI